MEALSQTLQPYKDIIGQVAGIVTIAQFFSGSFICKDIYKKGSTKGIEATPFIGGIVVAILMLKYAFILNDNVMFVVNVVAVALNLLYLAFYYLYSPKKWEEVFVPGAYATAMVAASLGYAEWEHSDNLEYRFGLYVTVLMLLLMGSPLKDVKKIIATKDASSIPFPMTFIGAITLSLWLLYGIVLLNNFMIFQNVVGLVLCLLQLALIFIYPKKETSGTAGQPKKSKKHTKKD